VRLDPRTPVLVGIGAVVQRAADPTRAREAVDLMAAALERAADDAGSRRLLTEADRIAVPKGLWEYDDPARLVAARVGAARARTVLAEIGVLQPTPVNDACRDIAAGRADIVLIVGGEAKHRNVAARAAGVAVHDTAPVGTAPDVTLRPDDDLWTPLEAERGLVMPVNCYAVMESALRHADGQTLDAHRDTVAALWAGFSDVAADNPYAWYREPVAVADIRDASATNRMLAFPYTKRHNSQWNVDQAAGLIVCAAGKARALGLGSDGWVFPLAGAESNLIVPLARRADLHRCPAVALAGARALALAGRTRDDLAHVDLYSCFPVAVRIQARELGLDEARPLTVTGGMTFAGGPLNNYVYMATVRTAELLRAAPRATGMVTAVSGMLTKQGVNLWSATPPAAAYGFADVTREAAAATAVRPLVADYAGPATVAGYTVVFMHDAPVRGIAVCDTPDGRRVVATTEDASQMAAMVASELCGCHVRIAASGTLTI
jgi:acetyl-CoA C-acetyltransferase